MKIIGFDIYVFNLPLTQPFVVKGCPISKREGLIIRLTTEDGSVGFGEVSPLPGFSRENLKEAKRQVVSLRMRHSERSEESLDEILHRYAPQDDLFPSVQFGLETAILNLLANKKADAFFCHSERSEESHLEEILRRSAPQNDAKSIPMIGLLQGSDVVSEARRMKKEGFKNFKLKVGAKNIDGEIEKVHRVQSILKNQGTLRLDANRFWKFEEAIRFGKALKKDSIEYIEEPFKNISTESPRVTGFFRTTGIPVALDESLVAMNPKNFKPLKGLKAFVLKPTILGGIEKTHCWVQRAKALKVQVVISSSFESGVGLAMLAQLAANMASPAGLDTYKYFAKDLLLKPLQTKRGGLIIPTRPLKENDLNFSLLKRI